MRGGKKNRDVNRMSDEKVPKDESKGKTRIRKRFTGMSNAQKTLKLISVTLLRPARWTLHNERLKKKGRKN